jgi:hypothetical protein
MTIAGFLKFLSTSASYRFTATTTRPSQETRVDFETAQVLKFNKPRCNCDIY